MSRNVIVISIEGIATSLVGAYGSSLAETPALDSLAAGGIVLDQCFLDSRVSEEMLTSLWSGEHALTRQLRQSTSKPQANEANADAAQSMLNIWRVLQGTASGVGMLVTDCPRVAKLAEQFGCERIYLVEQLPANRPASDVMQCAVMGLFSAAAEAIQELDEEDCLHRLCWIHSRGLRLPWDTPIELRNNFKDSEDPDPPAGVGPPHLQLTADTDPDEVLGWSQVAAAQTAVLDQAMALLQTIVNEGWSWCFIGIDGCPLGEHNWVGWQQDTLHDEQLQCVAIVRPWPQPLIGWRVAEVCQLPDLAATVAELCGLTLADSWGIAQLGEPQDASPLSWNSWHQVAVLIEAEKVWIRTPAWSCTMESEHSQHLYVKPDDRWEVSEVSNRCHEVVNELRTLANAFSAIANHNCRNQLPKLADILCDYRR